MRKIIDFFRKMKPRTWFIMIFLLFITLQFVLYPEMAKIHYVYAEDGGIFLDGYQKSGMSSIFEPFGGYIVLISRGFAAVSIWVGRFLNNFKYALDTMEMLNVLFVAFVLAYFVSDRFKFLIKKRSHRLIVGIMMLLIMSGFFGMLFDSVCVHWWCGLLMFFVTLELMNDTLPPIWMYPFIILCILSSPSSLVIGIGLAYYLIKKIFVTKKWRELLNVHSISFLLITIVPLAIQSFTILFGTNMGGGADESISVSRLVNTSSAAYDLTVSSSLIMFTLSVFKALFANKIAAIVGGLLWVVILYLAKKKNVLRYALMALGCIFFLYFLVFFKRVDVGLVETYEWITAASVDNYYNAVPAVISMMTFAAVLYQYYSRKHLIIEASVLILLMPHFVVERWRPRYDELDMVKLNEINRELDVKSNIYTRFEYGPHDYDVFHIPVNSDYCSDGYVHCESLK